MRALLKTKVNKQRNPKIWLQEIAHEPRRDSKGIWDDGSDHLGQQLCGKSREQLVPAGTG